MGRGSGSGGDGGGGGDGDGDGSGTTSAGSSGGTKRKRRGNSPPQCEDNDLKNLLLHHVTIPPAPAPKEENLRPSKKIKRPLVAYAHFEKSVRPLMKAEFPSVGGNVITQQIGLIWSYMSEGDKQKYRLLEQEGRAAYEEAMLAEQRKKKNTT